MSLENVERFVEEVLQNNPDLIQQLASADSRENFINQAIQLGQQQGFSFDSADIQAFLNQKKGELEAAADLDDQALEPIAGGKPPFDTTTGCIHGTMPNLTYCCGVSGCIMGSVC